VGIIIGLVVGVMVGYAVAPEGIERTQLEQKISNLEAQVVILQQQLATEILGTYFSPKGGCEDQILYWIERANTSIHILIYSFTLDSVGAALIDANNRGVDVKIVFEVQQISQYSEYQRLNAAGILVRNDTQLILVVRGMNNRIYYRSYNCTSEQWEGWIVVPTGVTCDSPAATILPNELHIVVRGISATNSSMWHTRLNLTTETFSGWTRLSGATESAPTLAASQTSNRLCLTVRGLNNSTYYNTWNGTAWEGWTVVLSGATCDGPAAAIIGDELHIVVRGMDGHSLWHYHINLSTSDHSGWTRISGATSSAPTLTS